MNSFTSLLEQSFINVFFPKSPFLSPLKTENLAVFWCFQGVEKGCIGNEWVNPFLANAPIIYLSKTSKSLWSSDIFRGFKIEKLGLSLLDVLTPEVPIPQNGQTHSDNSSAICRQIVWVCLTILWDFRLKGQSYGIHSSDYICKIADIYKIVISLIPV